MGRSAKPAKVKGKAKAKRPLARKSLKNEGSKVRDLEKRLAEALKQLQTRDRELTEALEQQTATGEILRVISGSPTDLQPVLDAVAEGAARLCRAHDATIFRVENDALRLVAHCGPITSLPLGFVVQLASGTAVARTVLERRPIHVRDAQMEEDFPESAAFARQFGYRTTLHVPLLGGDLALGVILIRRTEAVLFTDKQIGLLKTFADQAVIAIENVRLFKELEAKNADLTEALEQQRATSGILEVINTSPTDVQPVFDTIARSAAELCGGRFGAVLRYDGQLLHQSAMYNFTSEGLVAYQPIYPRPLSRETTAARAILDRCVVVVPDIELDPERAPAVLRAGQLSGVRSLMAVPMLLDESPIGAIVVARAEPGPFAENQIELLKTFARQAVIAVENVRLFKELDARNRDLTEALEQQTATSEILRVIAGSPTHLQPVLDTVAENAARVCGAFDAVLTLADGDTGRIAAHYGPIEAALGFEFPLTRGSVVGRAIVDARPIHVHDLAEADEAEFPEGRALARRIGHHTTLATPLMREGMAIGSLVVRRTEVRPFTDQQVALLQTFADQAVIAIENVRLFTELEARNSELRVALDTQTATSDILRVISRSQTDVQPVFDAIMASAVRLLRGYSGALTRVAGDQIELAALTGTDDAGDAAARARFPQSLQSEGAQAQAIRDRAPINIADTQTDPRLSEARRALGAARGFRSWVIVPLLRQDEAIGAIGVTRRDPGGFTDDEIALLKTFADQAVIAIENARLLTELQARTEELTRSVGELRALGEVGQAISSTLDLQTVLSAIVARATQLAGVDAGVIYEYDAQREVFEPRATERLEADIVQMLVATPVRKGQGATGRLAEVPEPIQLADVRDTAEQVPVRDALVRAGYRALLAVPLVRDDHLIGGLTVFRKTPGEFAAGTVDLLRTFATQSALAIQNARLFREIADKSRQLELASQHKSEFLANMSHELRTPLNAIIGFSEALLERLFGEMSDKQEEYLRDIHASGQHLLSLINDILDLSKIEAGRMELELAEFDLPSSIENALILVRERATRRGIALGHRIDERLGMIRADERKLKQVLLNLLANAIKFTPEGGRIDVKAVLADSAVEISVTDTGIGIAPEHQQAIFEEFRQVGSADKKAEGTGLGLALSRKFIELHGGRIWVKSQVEQGSTFTFTIPVRC